MTYLLSLAAMAGPLPPLPVRVPPLEPVANQCPKVIALVPGKPVPTALVDADGLVICSAVAVPTSIALDLRALESWGDAVAARYRLDVGELQRERDWYKKRVEILEEPPPFWQSASAARWGGRAEVLVTVASLAAIIVVADNQTR